jgi:hypothetical protein
MPEDRMSEGQATRAGRRKAERSRSGKPILLWAGISATIVLVIVLLVILLPGRGDSGTPTATTTPAATSRFQVRAILAEAPLTSATGSVSPSASGSATTSGTSTATAEETRAASGSAPPSGTAAATPAPAPSIDRSTVPDALRADYSGLSSCTVAVPETVAGPALGCTDTAKYLLGPAEVVLADVDSALTLAGNDPGTWLIEVRMADAGAAKLAALSEWLAARKGAPQKLAVVFDGRVVSVTAVTSPIADGTIQLHGDFTQSQALSLAAALSGE